MSRANPFAAPGGLPRDALLGAVRIVRQRFTVAGATQAVLPALLD